MKDPFLEPRMLLRQLEQRARRRFGQHFLLDSSFVKRIVGLAQVMPGDKVIEIGPGLGILTDALLKAEAQVTAIEIDKDLAGHLRETFPGLALVEGDAMAVQWDSLLSGGDWKLIANLPYNIGTTLFMKAMRLPECFKTVTVMLQQEVAQRIVAEPGTRAYGALSVEAQVRGDVEIVARVGPKSFYPPPKVHSAVIHASLFPTPDTGGVPGHLFDRVVKSAFAHRRKTILNSLSTTYPKPMARQALELAQVPAGARAEVLDCDQFRGLAAALHP
jgi:16S rRNA (adenine1518-N6/adenine1519-N6)-dimethyltransferase